LSQQSQSRNDNARLSAEKHFTDPAAGERMALERSIVLTEGISRTPSGTDNAGSKQLNYLLFPHSRQFHSDTL